MTFIAVFPPVPVAVPVADTGGTYFTPTVATTHTIHATDFSTPPPPGSKILFIMTSQGPAEAASWSWAHPPGQVVVDSQSSGYNPRLHIVLVPVGIATSWFFGSVNQIRVAGVVLVNTVSVGASAPVFNFAPIDPAPLANDTNSVGLVVTCVTVGPNAVTAPSTGHTTILNTGPDVRQIHVAKKLLPAAGIYDPDPATVGPAGESAITVAIVARSTAGSYSVPTPVVPTFIVPGSVTINPTDNAAAIVAANPAGTYYQLVAGTYTNFSDVRPKAGDYFLGNGTSTVLEGTGKNYAFRGSSATANNVTIGNMLIRNYGNATTRQDYGAIQPAPTDTVGGQYIYSRPTGWFVYDVELATNSSNGMVLSDNGTALRVNAWGHTVTGIGGDRCVGGLLHTCLLEANGLNPATGAASNGANVKVTWVNGDVGRTVIVGNGRPKAQFSVVNCTFNATRIGVTGVTRIGMWMDLDSQWTLIEACTFNNHTTSSILWEGGNNGVARNNTVNNSDGFGPYFDGDFANAGICVAESTNILVDNNILTGCTFALMNRQANRTTDWYKADNSDGSNYAWPTSLGGARYWISADGPLPVPAPDVKSNMWSGNNTFQQNLLIDCNHVVIQEGTDGGGMTTHGSTPLSTIRFVGNQYASSPGIDFYEASAVPLTLAQWRALPRDRDQ
jgi:hypothetical protein